MQLCIAAEEKSEILLARYLLRLSGSSARHIHTIARPESTHRHRGLLSCKCAALLK